MSRAQRSIMLGLIDPNTAWMERAVCRGVGWHIFFGERDRAEITGQYEAMAQKQALEMCRRCSVVQECLDYAVTNHLDDGVWGGMTARERRHRCSYVPLPYRRFV